MNDSRETEPDSSTNPADQTPAATSAGSESPATDRVTHGGAPTASDAPQPPQAPPGPPQPPTQPPAAQHPSTRYPAAQHPATQPPAGQPSAAGTPEFGRPTSSFAPPSATAAPAAFNTAPAPQPYAFGQNPYQRPANPDHQQTAQYPGQSAQNGAAAVAAEPGAAKTTKRSAPLGLVAALAVGALVGGVSGAGVAALAINANQSEQAPSSASNPANITVNDEADATVITAVAASAGPSVVTISVSDGDTGGGTGSGVILSDDGYVLTNTHVVTLDGATAQPDVSVQTSDGRLFQAEIVGTDPISDLAVIKMEGGSDFPAVEFADSDDLNVGDTAVAIGAPLGLANTVTNGIVSSLNRSITVASSAAPSTPDEEAPAPGDNGGDGPFDFWQFGTPDQQSPQTQASSTIALSVIQTDAAINPGNSGGALLDSDGKVIGINVAIASAGQGQGQSAAGSIGVGFAIPSNLAKRIATEIIETGTGSHGLLGAGVNDVTDTDATVVGALIEEVSDGGAAQAAGLRAGDVVTKVGDIPITGRTDLTAQIRALAAGAETTLTYVRNGDVGTADVTLGTLGE